MRREEDQSARVLAEEAAPPVPVPADPNPPSLLARVDGADRALACWVVLRTALLDHRIPTLPTCRGSPDAGFWLTVPLLTPEVAGAVQAVGCEAYIVENDVVRPITGKCTAAPGVSPPAAATLAQLPEVGVLHLLSAASPRPAADAGRHAVVSVLTVGPLARSVIRRCVASGFESSYLSVERRPLFGPDPGQDDSGPAVLLTMRAEAEFLPSSLVGWLTGLPYTIVGRPADPAGRLLVDVGYRLAVDDADLAREVPEGEHWAIGRHGRAYAVRETGRPHPVDGLLAAGGLPLLRAEPGDQVKRFRPESVNVDVIGSAPTGIVDAVLLADDELRWLREFVSGRPLADSGLLLLGPGFHVLTEPSGLVSRVPFGHPLRRIGPGGLYIIDGYALRPVLPPTARASLFSLAAGKVLVLCPDRSLEFRAQNAVPLWSLWLPQEDPSFETGVSERAQALLQRLDGLRPEARTAPDVMENDVMKRVELRRRAFEAQNDDDYERAADLLEEAGDFARAAVLWRRAALGREEH